MTSKMGDAALALAKRKIAVFPIKPRAAFPPLTTHGCKEASCSPERVESWWAQWPDANIGIATGKPSGVFVLDVDMKNEKNGEASLKEIEGRFGKLPATVEAITGSGGRHLYYLLPDFDGAPEVRNSASKIGDGLDIRGEGGYVVAPPSIHESGKRYEWSVDTGSKFAEAPIWFLGLLNPPVELDQRRPPEHWARIAREGVAEGARNHTTASLAGHLLRRCVDPHVVYDLAVCWNRVRNNPALSDQEVGNIVQSIAKREIARRRQ